MSDQRPAPQTRLDYALAYVALGWCVVPLHWIDQGRCTCGNPDCKENSWGKHPHAKFAPHGVHSGSKDAATVRDWYTREPRLNIGIVTGDVSGIVVLDVDPRNGGDITLETLTKQNGKLPATAMAMTGGGGTHYIFRHDGKRFKTPGKGLDVQSDGKLIVVEPSSHRSGKSYAWEGESDPLQGVVIALAPEWIVEKVSRGNLKGITAWGSANAIGHLPETRIADIRGALAVLDFDTYPIWVSVGQALHSTSAPEAFELWDEWSQRSAKYNNGDTVKKWATFSTDKPLHVESLFTWARDAGWNGLPQHAPAIEVAPERIASPKVFESVTPSHLLMLPGALGHLVMAINDTAPKCQPQFAVQTALAIGSVVMGRRYVTTKDNYTSLYFLAVGQSGCGKEYARKVIDRVLTDAKLTCLIGGAGYTSDSAITSELFDKPSHIAVMDEFGEMLKNAQAQSNFHKRQAIELLKSLWGQCDGTHRPLSRSTLGIAKSKKSEFANVVIERPALSLLGLTTPKQFYESLTEDSIEGGFLGRMMIVATNIGRQESNDDAKPFVTPQPVLDWCAATRQGEGNLAGVELAANLIPNATVIQIDSAALALFKAYGREVLAAQNRLEHEGMAELEGRSREKAMRLSAILAGSDNPLLPVVQARHAEWAIEYVRHYTAQTVAAVREHIHGSAFGRMCALALVLITKGGEQGRTERELTRDNRSLAGLQAREMSAVLTTLQAREQVVRASIGHNGGRGRPRSAWVAVKQSEEA